MTGKYSKVELLPDGSGYSPILKVKGAGRVDLGKYATDRLAAVAHDVARLVFIAEKRPSTDLKTDPGTHFPADSYLYDKTFKMLLANKTSFDEVCSLLSSGALVDQFCVAQDRITRHSSEERGLAGRDDSGKAPEQTAAPSEQQDQRADQPQQQEASAPCASLPNANEAPAGQPEQQEPTASPSKRKPMRWVEWPTKGGGQFVCCISERALKANASLPARMKRELFQVTHSEAKIAAYDMQPGSKLQWEWEVRDYTREGRSSSYIHNMAPFWKQYNAQPGDVLVVVASAPGAVKATVWPSNSPDAGQFKAHLEQQAAKAAGGPGAGSRKRVAESAPTRQAPTKVQRPSPSASLGPKHTSSRADAGLPARQQQQQQQSLVRPQPSITAASRPQTAAAAAAQHQAGGAAVPSCQRASQQPSPPRPAQAQARIMSNELPGHAGAGGGVSPPSGGEDTAQLSPTGIVVRSPYRCQPLLPLASATHVLIKQEQLSPPRLPSGHPEQHTAAGAGSFKPLAGAARETTGGAAAHGPAPACTNSPARMSCADASPAAAGLQSLPPDQQTAGLGAGTAAAHIGDTGPLLPDGLALAHDEAGVYVCMSRLLTLISSSGCVPAEAVTAYRRSFGHLEPAGRRWFHYDSLKQLFDAQNWAGVQDWLDSK